MEGTVNWTLVYRATVIILLLGILFVLTCLFDIWSNTAETNDLLKGIWDTLQENQDLSKDSSG